MSGQFYWASGVLCRQKTDSLGWAHSYRREKKVFWTENNCIEGNDNIAIGKDDYLLSPEGLLMPVKKGQKPPDLRYFQTQN